MFRIAIDAEKITRNLFFQYEQGGQPHAAYTIFSTKMQKFPINFFHGNDATNIELVLNALIMLSEFFT